MFTGKKIPKNLNKYKELLILVFFLFVFILIRSLKFNYLFTFFFDQVIFSTQALEIYKSRSLQLIGPPISISFSGRQIFQGGIIYYVQLVFLFLGHFDPRLSTYLFMIFSSFMTIPLYYGVKWLINQKAALFMLIIYSVFPFYISSTTIMWNANFQFVLTPLVILAMGLFHKNANRVFFLSISFLLGLLLQFHYQYVPVIFGFFIYYFLIKKLGLSYLLIFILGLCIGFSPIIVFELRNNFYNTNTIVLFLTNVKTLFGKKSSINFNYHYFLSMSFFALLIAAFYLRRFIDKLSLSVLFFGLFTWSFIVFVLYPSRVGFSKDWTYDDELIVYNIVKHNPIQNYNIVAFYDTLAHTQKYFLKRDGIDLDFNNYKTNKYLYVIYKSKDFRKNQAYEMNTFTPSRIIKTWKINNIYNLYLAERLTSP